MIRPIVRLNEILQLAPLAVEFYADGDIPGDVDPEIFAGQWHQWVTGGIGVIAGAFVDGEVVGGCGGLVVPSPNNGALEAHEMFWYLAKEHRASGLGIKCLEAWEQMVIGNGAERIDMIRLCNPLGEKIGAWLESKGYKPVEVHYCREVED